MSHHLIAEVGYLPSRILSIMMAVFGAINLVFSLMPFHNAWGAVQDVDRRSNIAYFFANRTGILSFANIVLAVLFGARNNPLTLLGGFSHTTSLTVHRWITRIATIEAIVHSILFTITYLWAGGYHAYAQEAARGYYWWGILATAALGLCVGAAALPLRLYGYETFLIGHIVLVILSLVGCWYHIILRYGKNWGYEVYLYITFTLWAFDRLVRLIRLLLYNQQNFLSPGRVMAIPGSEIMRVDVFPSERWVFRPGQHSFLHFHNINGHLYKFWESHPFSVALWFSGEHDFEAVGSAVNDKAEEPFCAASGGPQPSDPSAKGVEMGSLEIPGSAQGEAFEGRRSVTFFIKTSHPRWGSMSGLTSRLRAEASDHKSFPITVSTEGPYTHGVNSSHAAATTLLIGGGVGITALLGHVKYHFARQGYGHQAEHQSASRRAHQNEENTLNLRMVLAWSSNDSGFLNYIQSLPFLNRARQSGLDFHCVCTKKLQTDAVANMSTVDKRIQLEPLITAEAESCGRLRKLTVVSCGPAGLADEVRRVVALQAKQGFWVELIEEAFGW